ncbi:MAG TPA: hypothetical protein VK619_05150 [Pyrinomonadaceae bacterium]|nr:hypothetical protein [Pyrinomonadaceae bacterium]
MIHLQKVLKVFQGKPGVHLTVVIVVLTFVVFIQYYLINLPMPLDVNQVTPKITPAKATARSQQLILEDAVADASGLLASHTGRKNELVEAHFDMARLSDDTLAHLRVFESQIGSPPLDWQKIDLFARDVPRSHDGNIQAGGEPELRPEEAQGVNDDTCRTSILIEQVVPTKRLQSIRFFQNDDSGMNSYRSAEMAIEGVELKVSLNTMSPPSDNLQGNVDALGCSKLLQVGGWKLPLKGARKIELIVAAGSNFRFRFQPLRADAALWADGLDSLYEPFELSPHPFKVKGVSILSQTHGDHLPLLSVTSRNADPPLEIKTLLVGSDEIQIDYSGKGLIKQGDDYISVDIMDRLKKYPIPAGLLAMANTALIGWFVQTVKASYKSSKQKPKGSKRQHTGYPIKSHRKGRLTKSNR